MFQLLERRQNDQAIGQCRQAGVEMLDDVILSK